MNSDCIIANDMPQPASFSPREVECLSWCAAGKTAWETSRILGISEWTVVYHLEKLKRRLGISRKQELALHAASLGFKAKSAARPGV